MKLPASHRRPTTDIGCILLMVLSLVTPRILAEDYANPFLTTTSTSTTTSSISSSTTTTTSATSTTTSVTTTTTATTAYCPYYRNSCYQCWRLGCRYCEVSPISSKTERETQGGLLDHACVDDTNELCKNLLITRPNTGYAQTVPSWECIDTPPPTSAPTNDTRVASRDEEEEEEDMAVITIAVLVCLSVLILAMCPLTYLYFRNRAAKRIVRIVPDTKGTAPPATQSFKMPVAPKGFTPAMAFVTDSGDGGGTTNDAILWDFLAKGPVTESSISGIDIALQEAKEEDRQQGRQNVRRCLVFHRGVNKLGPGHLAALDRVLQAHPTVSLSIDSDWSPVGDADLRALTPLLRQRGRCVIRQGEAGISGPLRLPSGASHKVLVEIGEAIASADHKELDAVTLENAAPPPGSANTAKAHGAGKSAIVMLDPLRMNANELVQVSNRSLGDSGAALLCGLVVSRASRLQTVKLTDCGVGDIGVEAAIRLVKKHAGETLKELNLSSNHIGDRGAQAIADAMPTLDALERLCLDRNIIGYTGAAAIAQRLPRSEVRDLMLGSHLGGNPDIGDKGAIALAGALDDLMSRRAANRIGRLQALSLERCGVKDDGAKAIAAKLAKSALVTLSISSGGLTDVSAIEVIGAIPKTMSALDLSGNRLTDKTGLAAGDALAVNQKLSMSLAQNHISPGLHRTLQQEHGARLRL